jgi:hypothetical protein
MVNATASVKLSDSGVAERDLERDGCGPVAPGHWNRSLLPRLMPHLFFLPRTAIHI